MDTIYSTNLVFKSFLPYNKSKFQVSLHPAGFEPANSPIMSWVLLPLSHGCELKFSS